MTNNEQVLLEALKKSLLMQKQLVDTTSHLKEVCEVILKNKNVG